MEKLLLKLAVSETGFGNPVGGLSEDAVGKMCGYAYEHAKTKEELVSEVLSYADTFPDAAEGALANFEEDSCFKEEDLSVLRALIKKFEEKGFDRDLLSKLAAEDWVDTKETA